MQRAPEPQRPLAPPSPSQFFRTAGQFLLLVLLAASAAVTFSTYVPAAQAAQTSSSVDQVVTQGTWVNAVVGAFATDDGDTASTQQPGDRVRVGFATYTAAASTAVWTVDVLLIQEVATTSNSVDDEWRLRLFNGAGAIPFFTASAPATKAEDTLVLELTGAVTTWSVAQLNDLQATLEPVQAGAAADGTYRVDQLVLSVEFNEPPTANHGTISAVEGTTFAGSLSVIGSVSDPNPQDATLFYQLEDQATLGFVTVSSNGAFQYRSDTAGSDSFTYRARDNKNSLSAERTIFVTVVDVNTAPTFTILAGQPPAVDEDAGPQTVSAFATVGAGAAGESGQILTFSVAVSDASFFAAGPVVTVPQGGSTASLFYTPAPNKNGAVTVSLALWDNGGTNTGGADHSATRSFLLTVNPVNDAPVLNPLAPSTNEDATVVFTLSATDADQPTPTLSFAIETQPGHGSATIAALPNGLTARVTYTPEPDYFGTDSLVVSVSDGTLSSTRTFVITVNPVADAPIASAGADQTVAAGVRVTLSAAASFDPDTTSSVAVVFQWTQVLGPSVSLSSSSTVTPFFTAPANTGTSFLTLTFQVRVTESAGTRSATDTVQVFVRPPVSATGRSVSTTEDTPLAITLSGGGAGTLAFSVLADPQHGSLAGAGGGAVRTYTPSANFFGVDTFTFLVTDSLGGTASALVTVSISAVNDAPTIQPSSSSLVVDAGSRITLAAGIGDVDDVTITVLWSQVSGTTVSLSQTTSSTLSVSLGSTAAVTAAFNAPTLALGQNTTLVFRITVGDGSLTATRSITVTAQNGDRDLDAILDTADNCPSIPNRSQLDTDDDGLGDACDSTPDVPTTDTGTSTGSGAGEVLPPLAFGAGLLMAIGVAVLLGLGVVLLGRGGA